MGVVIGNYANTPEAVAAIANCVMVPMAFLSGSFFPIDTMPEWLQTFSRILPLRYLSDGLAGVITGTADLTDTLIACAGLVAFAVVFGLLGLKTFLLEFAAVSIASPLDGPRNCQRGNYNDDSSSGSRPAGRPPRRRRWCRWVRP